MIGGERKMMNFFNPHWFMQWNEANDWRKKQG
jgi:hypothetical protein